MGNRVGDGVVNRVCDGVVNRVGYGVVNRVCDGVVNRVCDGVVNRVVMMTTHFNFNLKSLSITSLLPRLQTYRVVFDLSSGG